MKFKTRGLTATIIGIIAFFLFGFASGTYLFTTSRSIIWLLRETAQGNNIVTGVISLIIELLFFASMLYICVDGGIRYIKGKKNANIPHAVLAVMVYATYSLAYPVYNKFLKPEEFKGFNFLDLVTTTTGIFLIIAVVSSIICILIAKKSETVKTLFYAIIYISIIILAVRDNINDIPNYGKLWSQYNDLVIFGPLIMLVSYLLFITAYIFETKYVNSEERLYEGYCGLNCKECEAYKATIHDDDTLREEVAKKWSKLNNAAITKDMINCEGCKLNGKKTPFCKGLCKLKHCAVNRRLGYCNECEEYKTCELAKPFKTPLEKK